MGSNATGRTARRKLRRKLESLGWTPEAIEAEVLRKHPTAGKVVHKDRRVRAEHAAATRRFREEQERSKADWEARRAAAEQAIYGVDDTGYKPTQVDSTLTGVARATGETAKAIRRGRTVTRHQYDERTTS